MSDNEYSPDDDDRAINYNSTAASSSSVSGNKRMALDKTNLTEKKLLRLEKNRMSARECRRRKKEATQQLEQEIYLLEKENLGLRLQLKIGEEAEMSSMREAEKLTEAMDASLKSGASDSAIFANLEEIKEKFADYGRDRRSAMEFHLRNVERLLMPTTTTSVAMKALEIGHSTSYLNNKSGANDTSSHNAPAEESSSATALGSNVVADSPASSNVEAAPSTSTSKTNKQIFEFLVQYLEVTPDQAIALKDSRKVAQELDSALAKSFSMLNELKLRLTQVVGDLETEFDSVRAILTPTQVAKFVVWIAHNGACMHMLNELWGKIYHKQSGATPNIPTSKPVPAENNIAIPTEHEISTSEHASTSG